MKKIKVSIQGFEGSYSHQATENIFKKNNLNFELVENETFSEAFDSIKKFGLGFIPVENSTAGFVDPAIDELVKNDFEIIGEYFLDINHVLLGNKKAKLEDIKEVHSHHQALMQTSNFLEKNKIKMIDAGDTAGGAKLISQENSIEKGALGASILAKIYNLKILAKNINNEEKNTTKFFLIRKKDTLKNLNDLKSKKEIKTAIAFKAKNIPGALFKALGGFATNGVDLTNIISRPIKNKRFGYLFFLEFKGDLKDEKVKNAMEELDFFSEEIYIFGSFKELK